MKNKKSTSFNIFFFPTFLLLLAFGSCQDKARSAATAHPSEENQKIYFDRVEQIAASLKAKADQPQDFPLAQLLVGQTKIYVKRFPQDKEHNPPFLFRAGEVARSIGKYQEALQLFQQVYQQYPDHKLAVNARFLEAHTYEDGIKDKKKAAQAYENLIKQHPKDPLAEQARQLLQVIDKTPVELIREFEKKNKQ